jgi:phage head maturation protease
MIRKPGYLETKAFDEGDILEHQFEEIMDPERVVRFVASDDSIDRYNEVVVPRGVNFCDFAKNSPLMVFHDYKMWPIGKCVAGEVRGNQLLLDAEFDPGDEDPDAEKVFRKIKRRTVKTGSIGFIPTKFITPGDEKKSKDASDLFKQYPNASRIYTDWELMEFSVVPIPANPNALAAACDALEADARRRFGPDPLQADMGSETDWSALSDAFNKKVDEVMLKLRDI